LCGLGYDPEVVLCDSCLLGSYAGIASGLQCTECPASGAETYVQFVTIIIATLLLLVLSCILMVKCSVRAAKKMKDDDFESQTEGQAQSMSAVAGAANDTAAAIDGGGALSGGLGPLINILTGYVQIMGQLGAIVSIKMPDVFQNFLIGLNFISLPVGQFVNSQCVSWQLGSNEYTAPFATDFAIKATMPFAILLVTGALYTVSRRYIARRAPEQIKANATKAARAYSAAVIIFLLNFFHPTVTATMFRVYLCEAIYLDEEDPQRWLIVDRSVECHSSNPQWTTMIAVSVLLTLIYTVGWPLFILFHLCRLHKRSYRNARGDDVEKMKRIQADHGVAAGRTKDGKPVYSYVEVPMTRLDTDESKQLLGSSYKDYEDGFYWFSVYETFRRTLQTAGVVIVAFIAGPEQAKDFELPFITFIAWLSLVFAAFALPYKDSNEDKVLLLVLLVVAVTWTGLQAEQLAGFGDASAFGSFLVALQVGLLVVIGGVVLPRMFRVLIKVAKKDEAIGSAVGSVRKLNALVGASWRFSTSTCKIVPRSQTAPTTTVQVKEASHHSASTDPASPIATETPTETGLGAPSTSSAPPRFSLNS